MLKKTYWQHVLCRYLPTQRNNKSFVQTFIPYSRRLGRGLVVHLFSYWAKHSATVHQLFVTNNKQIKRQLWPMLKTVTTSYHSVA